MILLFLTGKAARGGPRVGRHNDDHADEEDNPDDPVENEESHPPLGAAALISTGQH